MMMILRRKIGQAAMIGEEICIKVLMSDKGEVELGIRAPESLVVHREEVYLQEKHKKGDYRNSYWD